MPAFIDEVGNRYGRLLVVKRASRKGRSTYWLCRCDCGKEASVSAMNLRQGRTRSCGCLHAETARKNGRSIALPDGEAAFRSLYAQYRRNAKNRGYAFSLSLEEFRHLTQQNCHYCGSAPLASHEGVTYNGAYVYNGVDRLHNDEGYVQGNCVSCCKFCNLAKAGGTYEEFLAYLDRVVQYRGSR